MRKNKQKDTRNNLLTHGTLLICQELSMRHFLWREFNTEEGVVLLSWELSGCVAEGFGGRHSFLPDTGSHGP